MTSNNILPRKPYRPRKSDEEKQATAEAKKLRRKQYYLDNAERLREKSRLQMAEKRAAVKVKRRVSERKRDLAAAERLARETLTQMKRHREAQYLTLPCTASCDTSSTWRALEEQRLDREIAELFDSEQRGGRAVGASGDQNDGGHTAGAREHSTRISSGPPPLETVQRLRSVFSPPPDSNSPSPEPPGRMPSFLTKLGQAVGRDLAADTSGEE
ncbi:hypothetical protein R3P38DRAFT_3207670 [Favolaschia claudopus]|uniref:Uncharacterized protein n=1 Tax=Favolaschia claudopus TaxID=2862362 RepID=A0AAW0AJT8_9AGAR